MATFRQDGPYKDGRHPESVRFATAEEDAQRRDFTINGMFYDPVADRLIDYVGGEADLRAKVIRAIGDPATRFAEDHLRLLRAIRFATRFQFKIEPETWEAICAAAPSIRTVSAERIRDELNLILTADKPEMGLDLLDHSGLLREVLPDIAAHARRGAAAAVPSRGRRLPARAADADQDRAAEPRAGAGHPDARRGQEADGEGGRERPHPPQRARERRRGDERPHHDRPALRQQNHRDRARDGAAPHAVQGRAAHAARARSSA